MLKHGRLYRVHYIHKAEIVRLSDIDVSSQNDNLLLVIEVQAFELDVIRGIDWSHPGAYIVFEGNLNKSDPLISIRAQGAISTFVVELTKCM